jgi:hypothetical protein
MAAENPPTRAASTATGTAWEADAAEPAPLVELPLQPGHTDTSETAKTTTPSIFKVVTPVHFMIHQPTLVAGSDVPQQPAISQTGSEQNHFLS